jgi:coniferyl-aldehyde dehydrogenase
VPSSASSIGKCLNAGQTCIAPDYVLLPAGQEQAFIDQRTRVVAACYPDIEKTADYSTIVDQRQYARLCAYVDEARAGAKIVDLAAAALPPTQAARLPPVVLLDAGDELRVMQEEIFGPLLPMRPYRISTRR